jgi:hypothetical protein
MSLRYSTKLVIFSVFLTGLSEDWYFPHHIFSETCKSNQINFIAIMGPRGANRNYTYGKITHINSPEGKSWWLIEHDIQTWYKYIKYII